MAKVKIKKSDRYALFPKMVQGLGIEVPVSEHKFHPVRKWRFDFAWPEAKVALEVEGGFFMKGGGRHQRGAGARADMEKYNEAACMGWRILRIMPEQLYRSETFSQIRRCLTSPKPNK